jgi:hypothetical protein
MKWPSTNAGLRGRLFVLQPETSGGGWPGVGQTKRKLPMTIEAHIQTLEKKHGVLEAELHSAMLHPATGDTTISQIKREKLKIKDEIERLRQQTRH